MIDEHREGEWIVVDGRTINGCVFRDCIMEHRGGPVVIVGSEFTRCDFVGPWVGVFAGARADLRVTDPAPEDEVRAVLGRRKRWWLR